MSKAITVLSLLALLFFMTGALLNEDTSLELEDNEIALDDVRVAFIQNESGNEIELEVEEESDQDGEEDHQYLAEAVEASSPSQCLDKICSLGQCRKKCRELNKNAGSIKICGKKCQEIIKAPCYPGSCSWVDCRNYCGGLSVMKFLGSVNSCAWSCHKKYGPPKENPTSGDKPIKCTPRANPPMTPAHKSCQAKCKNDINCCARCDIFYYQPRPGHCTNHKCSRHVCQRSCKNSICAKNCLKKWPALKDIKV